VPMKPIVPNGARRATRTNGGKPAGFVRTDAGSHSERQAPQRQIRLVYVEYLPRTLSCSEEEASLLADDRCARCWRWGFYVVGVLRARSTAGVWPVAVVNHKARF
jgi:hypothetical protein